MQSLFRLPVLVILACLWGFAAFANDETFAVCTVVSGDGEKTIDIPTVAYPYMEGQGWLLHFTRLNEVNGLAYQVATRFDNRPDFDIYVSKVNNDHSLST